MIRSTTTIMIGRVRVRWIMGPARRWVAGAAAAGVGRSAGADGRPGPYLAGVLCGPVAPYRRYNLGSRVDRIAWCETSLRYSTLLQDLTDYLAADMLMRVWPDLDLPGWYREAAEDAHPHLAA